MIFAKGFCAGVKLGATFSDRQKAVSSSALS